MPVALSYPGVYIEEVKSRTRTVVGVSTSRTAFVGEALRGPVDTPVVVHSPGEFEQVFGAPWKRSLLAPMVRQFFENGGGEALVVRVVRWKDGTAANNAATAGGDFMAAGGGVAAVKLAARSEGVWGDQLKVTVDYDGELAKDPNSKLFNLTVEDPATDLKEQFRNVSADPDSARYFIDVVNEESGLLRFTGGRPTTRPQNKAYPLSGGKDGDPVKAEDFTANTSGRGLSALDKADLFNLLVIPPINKDEDLAATEAGRGLLAAAAEYCGRRRAFLLVDAPSSWTTGDQAKAGLADLAGLGPHRTNAAIYFPHIRAGDPRNSGRLASFPPSGAVAGVMARNDAAAGIWSAPAGQSAGLAGVQGLTVALSDNAQGQLNPLGINCLRRFPDAGFVVWGARTMMGSDALASEWKYVNVRRLTLHIELSLHRGTQWAVFQSNAEPLWQDLRNAVTGFMDSLYRQGAFKGTSRKDAFFVRCDAETTTQGDIDRGIVNVLVGFAPLKPAEFVVLKISQKAGQEA